MSSIWDDIDTVWARDDLTPVAKMVYECLRRHKNARGVAYPAAETIAKKIGQGVRSVYRAITLLASKNIITTVGKTRWHVPIWAFGQLANLASVTLPERQGATGQSGKSPIQYEEEGLKNPHEQEETDNMREAHIADVDHILDHHNKVMSKTTGKERQWRLTDDLKKKIRTRLKTFTVDDLKVASVNLSHSSWHTGSNPNGKEYCHPTWLFNSDAKVDEWLNIVAHAPVSGNGKVDTRAKPSSTGKYDGIDPRDK